MFAYFPNSAYVHTFILGVCICPYIHMVYATKFLFTGSGVYGPTILYQYLSLRESYLGECTSVHRYKYVYFCHKTIITD